MVQMMADSSHDKFGIFSRVRSIAITPSKEKKKKKKLAKKQPNLFVGSLVQLLWVVLVWDEESCYYYLRKARPLYYMPAI